MKIEIVGSPKIGGTKWFFRIKARNNKTLCHSEQYSSKQMARRAVNSIVNCKTWKVEIV